MQFVIEFYRTRKQDDAHAVIGRESAEAVDLEHAIQIAGVLAKTLAKTLAMPQHPDFVSIADAAGDTLRALELEANDNSDERRPR